MKLILCICLLLGTCISAFPQQEGSGIQFLEGPEWAEVLQLARERQKLIFMDCYTSWCGPCKGLAKNVFSRKDVGDFFNSRFINVKYDMEKGNGKELKGRFAEHIIGYPTLLLIDAEGNVLHRMAGYHEAEEIISVMGKASEGRTLFACKSRYEAGERDLSLVRDYVAFLQQAFLKDEAEKVVNEFMSTLPPEELKKKEIWNFLSPFIKDPYSPYFEYVAFNLDFFSYRLAEDRYLLERQLNWELDKALKQIISIGQDSCGRVQPLLPQREKIAVLERLIQRMKLKRAEEYLAKIRIYELELQENWDEVFNYVEVCRSIGALGSSGFYLNETMLYAAARCKKHKYLKKGVEWILELQQKDGKGKSLFKTNYYGTLALLYENLGNKAESRRYRELDREIKRHNEIEINKLLNKNRN